MELKEFVAESLKQIIEGVKECQKSPDGMLVNANSLKSLKAENVFPAGRLGTFTIVQFDIALSAETSGKGGASLKVYGFGVEGGAQHKQSSANRISFAVPIRLPDGDQERANNTLEE